MLVSATFSTLPEKQHMRGTPQRRAKGLSWRYHKAPRAARPAQMETTQAVRKWARGEKWREPPRARRPQRKRMAGVKKSRGPVGGLKWLGSSMAEQRIVSPLDAGSSPPRASVRIFAGPRNFVGP